MLKILPSGEAVDFAKVDGIYFHNRGTKDNLRYYVEISIHDSDFTYDEFKTEAEAKTCIKELVDDINYEKAGANNA